MTRQFNSGGAAQRDGDIALLHHQVERPVPVRSRIPPE
jgi:hypothetical protein